MTETLSGFWNSSWKTIVNATRVFYVESYQCNVYHSIYALISTVIIGWYIPSNYKQPEDHCMCCQKAWVAETFY